MMSLAEKTGRGSLQIYFFFSFFNCLVPVGFLPWKIRVAFPGESQLRQSRATQPTLHAGCFSVSIIHRTLTWTIGSRTCAQMLMHAIAHGGCTDAHNRVFTESWLWEKNPLPHRGIEPASAAWRSDALTNWAASPPPCFPEDPIRHGELTWGSRLGSDHTDLAWFQLTIHCNAKRTIPYSFNVSCNTDICLLARQSYKTLHKNPKTIIKHLISISTIHEVIFRVHIKLIKIVFNSYIKSRDQTHKQCLTAISKVHIKLINSV